MELQGSEPDRRHAQVIRHLERNREIPLQTHRELRGILRFLPRTRDPLRMTWALKTCGTTNKEKRRPGNLWASAVG